MGYRALEEMRKKNVSRYQADGPRVPAPAGYRRLQGGKSRPVCSLEREAVAFLRESCEDLGFDPGGSRGSLDDLDGTSTRQGQIPYNMEKDIDRLCLENAVHRFLETGIAEDAFDVYFCYLEMFVGNYGESRKMIEMLAEFESNAGSLLMKHRDHYSHSVYVFLIGLAIYHSNPDFRRQYGAFYGFSQEGRENRAACHFLKYWGMAALFHDIGYPFELPAEQVKSYFGNSGGNKPYMVYRNVDEYVDITGDSPDGGFWQSLLLGGDKFQPKSLDEILAHNMAYRLEKKYGDYEDYRNYQQSHPDAGYREYLTREVLSCRPSNPEKFGNFMDHAYFSAVLLFKELLEVLGPEQMTECAMEYMDVLTAILLHNSLYKFSITNYKSSYNQGRQFDVSTHPLAFLLMLCDELQCWDRASYGQNSRNEVHAMDCELEFHEKGVSATYVFDQGLKAKAGRTDTKGTYRKLVTPDAGHPVFLADIEKIVHINEPGTLQLTVGTAFGPNNRLRKKYLSNSNFLHLYHFAVALNGRYTYMGAEEQVEDARLEADFQKLSLEYKLSNINQAKKFAGHLDAIGCFYTDRPVAYGLVTAFTPQDLEIIGPREHLRWLAEKQSMGWSYGEKQPKAIREQTRTHELMMQEGVPVNAQTAKVHYEELPDEEKDKDIEPMNSMLKLIEKYDGLRIYQKQI